MNFEIGDKVIIPSKPDIIFSDEPDWVDAMNDYIGKEGVIDIIPKDGQIRVRFRDGDCWWYSLRWFETNIFEIGDKVRIRSNSRNLYRGSVSGMEKYDGQIGVIINHDPNDNTYKVQFDDKATWWYRAICFELLNNNLELNNLELLLI